MDIIKTISNELTATKEIPNFKAGDNITVYYTIKEGEKQRTQLDADLKSGKIDDKTYDERLVISNFKRRHAELQSGFTAKPLGELNIFWVGASEAQDNSGFLQALDKLGNVRKFYNSDHGYGPLYEIPGKNWLEVRLGENNIKIVTNN